MLTVKEVAEIFKVHHMTVRRLIEKGELKAARIGRSIRIDETDLKKFIKSKKIAGDQDV